MIAELLAAIGSGQPWSMAELSRHLGASEGMVAQMLNDLAHRGYVEPEGQVPHGCPLCAGGCAGCSLLAPSNSDGGSRVWRLTEKGQRRALAQRAPHGRMP